MYACSECDIMGQDQIVQTETIIERIQIDVDTLGQDDGFRCSAILETIGGDF